MKNILIILFIFNTIALKAQHSSIKGVVSYFNSKIENKNRKYVPNATVRDNVAHIQQALTHADGSFELIYDTLAGITESFEVIKKDLVVVNFTALTAVTGQINLVRVSMATPAKIAEYRAKIYKAADSLALDKIKQKQKQLNDSIKLLSAKVSVDSNMISALQGKIRELEENKMKVNEMAEDLASKYSQIDLDDASPEIASAFLLFQSGQLDSALAILQGANFPTAVKHILSERKAAFQLDSTQKAQSIVTAEGLRLKINLHIVKLQVDSADACYSMLFELDSSNVQDLIASADFLHGINLDDRAIIAFHRAEMANNDRNQKGMLFIGLGQEYLIKGDLLTAKSYLEQALSICMQLAITKPDPYLRREAAVLRLLANTYDHLTQYEKTFQFLQQSERILENLLPSPYVSIHLELSKVHNYLGELYNRTGDTTSAFNEYKKAFQAVRPIYNEYRIFYDPQVASIEINLANLYMDEAKYVSSHKVLLEALNIYSRLDSVNPYAYKPQLALTRLNLGFLYSSQNDLHNAELEYRKSIEDFKKIASTSFNMYFTMVTKAEVSLGYVYLSDQKYDSAIMVFTEAISISRRIVLESGDIYKNELASALHALAYASLLMGNSATCKTNSSEAINLFQYLKEADSLCWIYLAQEYDLFGQCHVQSNERKIRDSLIGVSNFLFNKLISNVSSPQNNYQFFKTLIAALTGEAIFYQNILVNVEVLYQKIFFLNRLMTIYSQLYKLQPRDSVIRAKYSQSCSDLAFTELFARDFLAAENLARTAIATLPTNDTAKIPLAHSLFFQGKLKESKIIYSQLKGLRDKDGVLYTESCLEDLYELEKDGITNEKFTDICQYLKSLDN